MKLLLVYPPFCTPTVMPYSISYIKNFISSNLKADVKCLDLNAKFHKRRFPEFYLELKRVKDYPDLLNSFDMSSRRVYSINNKQVVQGGKPELFEEMLQLILDENPDYAAFSLVYNSQCFFALRLIEELSERGIKCLIGGPAANSKLREKVVYLADEVALLEYLGGKVKDYKSVADFSDFDENDYLSREIIIPLKSSNSCYYKQCTFCTHHHDGKYYEINLDDIKETIVKSARKHFFFIDDMISKKRLLEIASILKPLSVKWWCQLRPTKELLGSFKELYDSGLRCISWGVESGSQRILELMKKGTNVSEVKLVLKESHDAGIRNVAYIMFGFPTESNSEFMQTIDFLKENSANIDLVSTTTFGLQKASKIFENPSAFGIAEIYEEKRTVLDEKITYKVKSGMQMDEVKEMRRKNLHLIKKIDKLPRVFNYFKEQIIIGE